MAKNYILEPVELEFGGGFYIPDSVVFPPERILAIPQNAIAQINDMLLKVNSIGTDGDGALAATVCLFTPNGVSDGDANVSNYLNVSYDPSRKSPFSEDIIPENNTYTIMVDGIFPDGVYTISIYTETEDAPDADPGAGLSKNIVHTDHPYNDVEAFLAKQGDPKTGYNTVEKISNATISSEGDGGSSGGIKAFDASYIDGYPEQITVTPNDVVDSNTANMLLIPNYSLENGEFGLIYFTDGSLTVNAFKDIGSVSGVDPQGLLSGKITIASEKTCHVIAVDGGLFVVLTSLDDIVYGTSDVTPK